MEEDLKVLTTEVTLRCHLVLNSPEIVELEPQEAIAVRGDVAIAGLPGLFERAFHEAADASGVEMVGPPFGFSLEMPTETVAVEAGFPVSAPAEAHGNAHRRVLPGRRVVLAVHVGPYDTMEKTSRDLQPWTGQGLQPAVGIWECRGALLPRLPGRRQQSGRVVLGHGATGPGSGSASQRRAGGDPLPIAIGPLGDRRVRRTVPSASDSGATR